MCHRQSGLILLVHGTPNNSSWSLHPLVTACTYGNRLSRYAKSNQDLTRWQDPLTSWHHKCSCSSSTKQPTRYSSVCPLVRVHAWITCWQQSQETVEPTNNGQYFPYILYCFQSYARSIFQLIVVHLHGLFHVQCSSFLIKKKKCLNLIYWSNQRLLFSLQQKMQTGISHSESVLECFCFSKIELCCHSLYLFTVSVRNGSRPYQL